jgi:hypothetical protein
VEGEGEGLVIGEDYEMSGFQHVSKVPHSLTYRQELSVVSAVLLLCWAQLPGGEGERLPGGLYSLL